MNRISVNDSIIINKSCQEVFQAITNELLLTKWWPKSAEIDPQIGGKIIFYWFNGATIRTRFETFLPDKEVSFEFAKEFVSFTLFPQDEGSLVTVCHSRIDSNDKDGIIHIAQSWKFLLMNLKLFLEYGLDFRNT